jgi:hypothetical protein
MIAVLEYLVYPLIALLFVAVFTREVIAPASRNLCDRRWLIYSSALGALTLVCTLALGWLLEERIRQHALLDVGARWNPLLVGLLSFFITSFVFTGGTAPPMPRICCGACSTSCITARGASRC